MSRIGRLPVELPDGVSVKLDDATNTLTVKGPKGELSQKIHESIDITIEDNIITVNRKSDSKFDKSLHGLTRSLINNMVLGVTKGFEKTLEIDGVGYRAQKQGKN
jgi:Ribosomal protein L6P/L9E